MASKPMCRVATGAFVLLWIFFAFAFMGGRYRGNDWYSDSVDKFKQWTSNYSDSVVAAQEEEEEVLSNIPISYNLDVAPKIGCESIVNDLQHRLISSYTQLLKGIRYVNIWGYLETENKGDAAIWSAQQILLSMMGIETVDTCRYMNKGCDLGRFNRSLNDHKPFSAIIMAGGGNFNDHYWDDQPARIAMIDTYHDVPIRAFPQSVHMMKPDRIEATKAGFKTHPNLQLAARDKPSYDWLADNLSQKSLGVGSEIIKSVLVPDIAFMWGNRPDFRTETKKQYDIVILARDDKEISAGNSKSIPFGTGLLDLGGSVGNVSYWKVDWKFTHTPGIDQYMPGYLRGYVQKTNPKPPGTKRDSTESESELDARDFKTPEVKEFIAATEPARNARAWNKAIAGFELLGSGRFVITDRLHGHIMSTIIGVPHVLMDSKLGKNLNFHDTWTQDCECTRITDDFDKSLKVARKYFESVDDGLTR